MKITALTATQQQAPTAKTKASGDFASVLAQHTQAPAAPQPAMTPAVLGIQATLAQETERTVMKQLTALMDQWDAYASSVEQADLKQGHAILSAIHRNLAAVKEAASAAPNLDARLREMVNELEVLGAAEEIKLNRGDYL
jgi:hypothetical protein